MEKLLISFNSGEIAPSLFGRIDLPKFESGLRVCQNFMILSQGGAARTPGKSFLGNTRDQTKRSRLIPFIYSITQAYMLEFGELYMKVIKDSAYVTDISEAIEDITLGVTTVITITGHSFSDGDEVVLDDIVGTTELNGRQFVVTGSTVNTFELQGVDSTVYSAYVSGGTVGRLFVLTTTYLSSELPFLKYTQSADTMTLTLRGVTNVVKELTRTSHSAWTLTDVVFSPSIDGPNDQVVSGGGTGTDFRYKVTALKDETEEESLSGLGLSHVITGITQADPAVVTFSATHNMDDGDEVFIDNIVGMTELNGRRFIVDNASVSTVELKGEDSTGYSAWISDGIAKETFVKLLNAGSPSSSNKHTLGWTEVADAFRYNIYQVENGIYGYLGSTKLLTFINNGSATLDLLDAPPEERDPFQNNNNPGAVAYFEQRRVFGGAINDPSTLFFAQTDNDDNMGVSFPVKADDAITIKLRSDQVNEVRHLVSLEDLIVLAADGEWKVSGGVEPLTATNILARMQSGIGSSHVRPLIIGSSVLFVQNKGSKVRDMSYAFNSDSYEATDLSLLAGHLVDGFDIEEWAYSQSPNNIVWCIRNDGVMLGLTYIKEHQIWGWHRHITDGEYESVASIPEGDNDVVYVIVKRTINGVVKRYVERMDYYLLSETEPEEAFFVDSGKTVESPAVNIEGASQTNPVVIESVAHGYSDGDIVRIDHVEGMTELNKVYFRVSNKTADDFELQTEDGTGTNVDGTGYEAYESGGDIRLGFDTVVALDHLEGKSVSILGDGSVYPQEIVTGGKITLDRKLTRVHVGLGYESRLETLDLGLAGGASVSGKRKRVTGALIKFDLSRGGELNLSSNPDSKKVTLSQRQVEGYGKPINLISGDELVSFPSGGDRRGSIVYINSDPLPVTILSINKEFSVGEN